MAQAPVSTGQRRSTRRNVLEAHAPEVVAIIASGERPADVARLYGVERSAITRFSERHSDDIAAMSEQMIKAVEDYHIAHKVNRIAALDELYGLMAIEARQNGIVEEGDDGRYFRDKLVSQMRGVLKDAADELGQIPRPDVHNTLNVGILVRQLAGYNPEDIG